MFSDAQRHIRDNLYNNLVLDIKQLTKQGVSGGGGGGENAGGGRGGRDGLGPLADQYILNK